MMPCPARPRPRPAREAGARHSMVSRGWDRRGVRGGGRDYAGHPWAFQLRAMNTIYETTKERGATILMLTSMVDSLNPSAACLAFAVAGNAALANK